ncbi:MAG: 50S ribosomal protein L4 [bacterium]
MQVSLFDKNGKKSEKKVTLVDSIFKTEVNEALLNQAVYVYLNNQRETNAHTKDRGDVSGGGRKPWRQKGTGRARHGSTRSPIWRKGGVTFGPKNTRNYKGTLSKKMRKAAICSAFSYQIALKKIVVFEDIEVKAKQATKELSKLFLDLKEYKKILIVQAEKNQLLVKAAANLKNNKTTIVAELNVYSILNSDYIIILEKALPIINKNWEIAKEGVSK